MTTPVIAVATAKGGAGKTTLLACVAGFLSRLGHPVAALDTDPLGAFSSWAELTEAPSLKVTTETDAQAILPAVRALQADGPCCVLIDTAGIESQQALFAIGAADLVLIPTKPSRTDAREALRALGKVRSTADLVGRAIDARLVVNEVDPRTSIAKHVIDQELAGRGAPLTKARLRQLTAFREITFAGGVPETGPAAQDVRALMRELSELVGLPLSPPATAAVPARAAE